MLADPDLDVVYIATVNNLHFEHTMLCLEAGKAVLCEKPFASNVSQVEQMVNKAREKNVFLMEGLWSRFLPSMIQLKEQAFGGAIKKPLLFQCNYGFIAPFDPSRRIYDLGLGGGSVPDIGIYTIFTAMYLFGKPEHIQVTSVPSPTGTDWTTSILFKHKGKEISMLTSSFEMILDNEARLYGEGGCIKLHDLFSKPTRLTVKNNDNQETEIPVDSVGNGMNYEAAEVMNCMDKGFIESPSLPHTFSIDLMAVIDEVVQKATNSY
jgi:predicted dehydrogenase